MLRSTIKPLQPSQKEIDAFPALLSSDLAGNDSAAQRSGEACYYGMITKRNIGLAKQLFGGLSKKNSARAEFFLVRIAIEENNEDALRRLLRLVERDYTPAIFLLGQLHMDGILVKKDQAKTIELWRQASQKGHLTARVFLYRLLAETQGPLLRLIYRICSLYSVLKHFRLMLRNPNGDEFLT